MAEFFKVGDHVRVRQWDDMAAEFPMRASGSIGVAFAFTHAMREYCGMSCIISEVKPESLDGRRIQRIKCPELRVHSWSNEMFEFDDPAPKISIASMNELL